MKIKLWAIIDISNSKERFCYANNMKLKGEMALYDKKPKIESHWKHFKKVVRVLVETIPEKIIKK